MGIVRKIGEYTVYKKIGEGTYGRVYKVCDTDGNYYALKKYDTHNSEIFSSNVLRELNILSVGVVHPNIVRCEKIFTTSHNVYSVLELADCDLQEFISSDKLDNCDPLKIFHDIASGLKVLHHNSVIHCDLKPHNCLVKDGIAKIADLDVIVSPNNYEYYQDIITTLWYRSPEIILEDDYNNKIDIWALGLILYQLYNKYPLITGDSEIEVVMMIKRKITDSFYPSPKGDGEGYDDYTKDFYKRMLPSEHTKFELRSRKLYYSRIPENVLDLLSHLLEIDSKKRYNIDQVLAHPCLEGYNTQIEYVGDIFYNAGTDREYSEYELSIRKQLICKIRDISNEYSGGYIILLNTINIFDRYNSLTRNKSELCNYGLVYILSAFYISLKFFPITFTLNDVLSRVEEIHEKDIIDAEREIICVLGFRIYHKLPTYVDNSDNEKFFEHLLEKPIF